MNSPKKIFFCGPILNHVGLKIHKGETPAASQWTKGLIQGLINNGVEVNLFSPIWDSYFPKGKLMPHGSEYLDSSFNQIGVKYLNFPFLRTLSVAGSLNYQIQQLLKNGDEPLAIINYNPSQHYVKALKEIKKKFPKITWINIILDFDDPNADNWGKFMKLTAKSDGSIFLSWWGYLNAPIINKLHLDSGWDGELPKIRQPTIKKIIYAGKLFEYGGIKDMIAAIKLVKRSDVKFVFFGKGYHEELNKLSNVDPRVEIRGFVSDEELHKACSEATAFLSPRDLNFKGTRMIFPSKILFYLKYRKPIISQLLPGLSPEYGKLLIVPNQESPRDWAEKIAEVIEYDSKSLIELEEKINIFLNHHTWDYQANRLLNFINSVNS